MEDQEISSVKKKYSHPGWKFDLKNNKLYSIAMVSFIVGIVLMYAGVLSLKGSEGGTPWEVRQAGLCFFSLCFLFAIVSWRVSRTWWGMIDESVDGLQAIFAYTFPCMFIFLSFAGVAQSIIMIIFGDI